MDDTLIATLDEIDNLLAKIDIQQSTIMQGLKETHDSVEDLSDTHWGTMTRVWARRLSFAHLNAVISKKINDIDLAISSARATTLFGESRIDPIVIEEGNVKVQIAQNGKSNLKVPQLDQSQAGYFVEYTVPLNVEMTGQDKKKLALLQRITFGLDAGGAVRPIMLNGPRFLKNGEVYDLISRFPVKRQNAIRHRLVEAIRELLSRKNYRFQTIRVGNMNLPMNPINYYISSGLVGFAVKTLSSRRSSKPLISWIHYGYDQVVTVPKEMISKEIARNVVGKATLRSIQYKPWFVRISTDRSEVRRFLWVKVNVWVRLDYRLFFTVSNKTNLLLDAKWAEWEIQVNAKQCWPKCDEVVSAAMNFARGEVEKNKYFTEFIADLSTYAYGIRTEMSSYGLQIHMRGK